MAILKPFKGIRPVKDKVSLIASRPYDVLNKSEARKEAEGNPFSFLHVIKPEIDLSDTIDEYDQQVYRKGKENFDFMLRQGVFFQDDEDYLYVYAQTMNGRTQYGLVGCAAVDDYMNNVILRHENTRPDKEEDRKNHIRISSLNYEPVFFAYPQNDEIDKIVKDVTHGPSEYDFTSSDGFGHHFWVIRDKKQIHQLINLFSKIKHTYVADGHHRTAAAALVGNERKGENNKHSGKEEYNYFLAVHFPANQLAIIDYNRLVKDLNGLTSSEFKNSLSRYFFIEEKGKEIYSPSRLHNFSMYFEKQWYSLSAKNETFDDNDPIRCLDVTILSDFALSEVLGIKDLRKSKRIDFVGGIRGLKELQKRVDSGEMAVAFALYPVTMKQLMDIADSGNIMPPKTTWFEPKLRSGLVIHALE
jgi:uncharacterized protein (DUF1015 family)